MKKFNYLLLLFVLTYSCINSTKKMENTTTDILPPIAKKKEHKLTIHGNTRIDNYYWLNERENPEVIKYLEEENAYTKNKLKHTEAFQEKLFNEFKNRIKEQDESVPYFLKGYYYYTRYEIGSEYPIYCRKKNNLEANEEIMLDVNKLAKDYDYYSAFDAGISTNNKILAYAEDTVSRRKYTLKFKNLETGENLPDAIGNTTGGIAWANDNKTIFYVVKDDALRGYKILRHVLGTPVEDDIEIFHEKDETFDLFVYKSKSDAYIIMGSYSTLSKEYRFLDANNPRGNFKIIQPRERNLEYDVYHYGNHFYIKTNLDAKNFRLMKTSVNKTEKENWIEVIPHRPNVLIEGIEIFSNYLVVNERNNGLNQLRVINWLGNSDYYIDFGEETYSAYIGTNPEFDTDILRFEYTSLTTPNSTFDYNMKTKEKTLMKQQEIVGDFNPNNYHAERIFATAKDGTKIPISLVYRNDMKKPEGNPLLLYAYGSYGSSMDAYFSSLRLSLLDRGFIYAIAHVRGGEDLGREWYENGKLLKKKNTFTDFIDCGEFLIKEKYALKDELFAMGGSAGGLLMGAIVNMRPNLWRGVVAAVPFVDVVTTMLDESIPLTTGEYDEWGNPNEKEYYDYMLSYSPYDNVKAQNYPNLLVTTGLHDSQVQYWEPAKWVAKMRDMKTDNNLLLLHTNMSAGHGGASGRFASLKESALEYAFIFNLAGINN